MLHFSKWSIWVTLGILLAGLIFAAPNLLTREQAEALPSWLPHKQISLGLDLRGGSYLLLEVDVQGVINDQLQTAKDSVRDVLQKAKVGYTGIGVDNGKVVVKLLSPADADKVRTSLHEVDRQMTLDIDASGNVSMSLPDTIIQQRQSQAVDQSIEVVRRRVDETGVKEPTIQRQGDNRILVQVPGVANPQELEALLEKTAKMTFQFVDQNVPQDQVDRGQVPPEDEILPMDEANARAGGPAKMAIQKRVIVSGEHLVQASASFDQYGAPDVQFKFDSVGGRQFCAATKDNIGRLFAIVLDKKIISAPRIQSAICGGDGIITGHFTTQEANQLAILLNAGALPATLTKVEGSTVGADLGADSIAAGKLASIMGIVLVVVAMVIFYGMFGLFADVALIFNGILLLAAMSLLQATLTLPGIAGVVLTLGMAVDANVLIYERIREEMRNGRGPVTAIDQGYRGAMGTIWDSHITTIVSAIALYAVGTGPIKGFAVTLGIGLVISLFTAVVVVRLITATWLRHARPKELPL